MLSPIQLISLVVFGLALLHTFAAPLLTARAARFASGSFGENLLHLLGEIEIVFALWAAILFAGWTAVEGAAAPVEYFDSRDLKEPMFVFAVMLLAATRPIMALVERAALFFARVLSRVLRVPPLLATVWVSLSVGPLLGSLITEPAAMTVTALMLSELVFSRGLGPKVRYAIVGCLFVNISIGGALTHFAAPPIVMVASVFNWDTPTVFSLFGYKALFAVVANATLLAVFAYKELSRIELAPGSSAARPPLWVSLVHAVALAAVVLASHHPILFMGVVMLFVGFHIVTEEHQIPLRLRESLLVALFLAGLVVLGGLQQWWLKETLTRFSDNTLFFVITGLTALTDNAALTYLGSLVPLADSAKYALVAGAVAGGGLTVIANAPNPAGYSILKSHFADGAIAPLALLLAATPFTVVVVSFLLLI